MIRFLSQSRRVLKTSLACSYRKLACLNPANTEAVLFGTKVQRKKITTESGFDAAAKEDDGQLSATI